MITHSEESSSLTTYENSQGFLKEHTSPAKTSLSAIICIIRPPKQETQQKISHCSERASVNGTVNSQRQKAIKSEQFIPQQPV